MRQNRSGWYAYRWAARGGLYIGSKDEPVVSLLESLLVLLWVSDTNTLAWWKFASTLACVDGDG